MMQGFLDVFSWELSRLTAVSLGYQVEMKDSAGSSSGNQGSTTNFDTL